MDTSLEAQYVFERVVLELRSRSVARLPLQQILDELFLCWRSKRPPPDGCQHFRAGVVVRDGNLLLMMGDDHTLPT